MLTVIRGGADGAQTKLVFAQLKAAMDRGEGQLVLLTPEQQSHRAERELAAYCGPRLSLFGEVLSFTRLYTRAAAETGGLADPIPDKGARLLLLALALEEVAPSLRHYGAGVQRGDWLERLLEAMEELESSLTEPDDLLAAAEKAEGAVGEKLRDLALLQMAYRAALERRLGDSRDRVRRLADMLPDCTVGAGGVWVDGFTDFTAAELQALDALLRRGTDLTVTLPLPDLPEEGDEGGADAFRLPGLCYARLADMAARRGVEFRPVSCPPEAGGEHIRILAEGLFGPAGPVPEGEAPVELMHMDNYSGECRYAAARILELLRADPELRFQDFAVAIPDPGRGSALPEAVFREYGVPFFPEETSALGDTGLAAFLLDALRTVTEGWRYTDVFSCLKSGLGGLAPEETDLLENYCLTWSLRGESVWAQEEAWDRHPRGYVKEWTEEDREELERVDALRRKAAAPLLGLSADWKKAETGRDYLAAICAYIRAVDLGAAMSARAERLERMGEVQAADACLRQWDALMACFEQFREALGEAVPEGRDVLRYLELLLRSRSVGAIPAALDCVSLGSPGRLRGRRPKVLILLGADDTALPGSPGDTGIFTLEERRELCGLGLGLQQDPEEALSRRMYDLYQITAAPTRRLIVTYSGAESRPSLIQRRARELFGVDMGEEEALGERHLAAAPEPCFRLALAGGSPLSRAAAGIVDRGELERVRSAALRDRGSLSRTAAAELYGRELRLTASRTETFFSCRYRYFLQYGLRARERRSAGFQAPELGTFLHFVLEGVCREAGELGGFRDLPRETLSALTDKYTEAYVRQFLRGSMLRDPRFSYLFHRLRRSVDAILRDVAEELSRSEFRPLDFELSFGMQDGELPPLRMEGLTLSGTVDRVDGWLDGDTLYLCVADYKTGSRSFSLTDVWYGLGIQMLLYLFTLEREGAQRYGAARVVPAGVLYAPARDLLQNLPRSAAPEEIEKSRSAALKRTGLLLDDERVLQAREAGYAPRFIPVKYAKDGTPSGSLATAAQLGRLAKYIRRLLEKMRDGLRAGSITADPLARGTASPCDWCPYTAACGFRDGEGTDCLRLIRTRDRDEFWNELGEEERKWQTSP